MPKKRLISLLSAVLLLFGSLTSCSASGLRRGETVPVSPEDTPSADTSFPLQGEVPPAPELIPPDSAPLLPVAENMMETIDALCREPRPLGSRAEYQSALYLRDRLEGYGYSGELEPFSYNISQTTLSERYRQARELPGEDFLNASLPGENRDGDSQNVVGMRAGDLAEKPVLILSAHYDSAAGSMGVVDNAAGVAVVLEAARILADEDLPFSLRIVFFGGEEAILIGSRQHVLRMSPEERPRILGNINVDTLAYSRSEEFVALTPLALPREDGAALAAASPVAAALLADSRVTPDFRSQLVSDHLAFSAAGIDSVNFGQSMDEVNGIINTPLDTYDLLVPELLPTASGLLVDAVRVLAARAFPAEDAAGDSNGSNRTAADSRASGALSS